MIRGSLKRGNRSDRRLFSRLREAVALKDTGFFLAEELLLIPVPEWEGWKYINHEKCESVDHFARWESFFHPREERFWIFLRITWPSVPQIILGFFYPDDLRFLEAIARHRRLGLLDLPLLEGQPHPLSKGIIVHDIPTDLLRAFGIGQVHGDNPIQ